MLDLDSLKTKVLLLRSKYNSLAESSVSIITCTNKPQYARNILNNFNSQMYKNKEMVLVINNNKYNINYLLKETKKYKNIKIIRIDEKNTLGKCFNTAVDASIGEYIAKFDDDDFYGPNYLIDMIYNLKESNADIVGKLSYFVYFEKYGTLGIFSPYNENCFTSIVAGSTLTAKREVFKKIPFVDINAAGEDTIFLQKALDKKYNIYSSDIFNYVYMKHINLNNHTWKIKTEEYIKSCKIIEKIYNYKKIVTF